jgi:hypothetical protein
MHDQYLRKEPVQEKYRQQKIVASYYKILQSVNDIELFSCVN